LAQDFGKNNAFWTYDYLSNFSHGIVQIQFQRIQFSKKKCYTKLIYKLVQHILVFPKYGIS
jgi:hypothetical protein